MNAYIFINYTEEDFSHAYDGRKYMFLAGSERILEESKAMHFAKHLTDREMQKAGQKTLLDPVKRQEILDKCLVKVEDNQDTEDMPEEDKVFEAQVKAKMKNKGGRPKKQVEEFEGLTTE
jgi:hypothetical protein